MVEYRGPLEHPLLSRTLWLVVAGPLLGLAWELLVAGPRFARAADAPSRERALASGRRAGVAGVVLATAAVAAHAWLLFSHAGAPALYDHVLPGPQLGDLGAPIDLWMDLPVAIACALACASAVAAAVVLATRPAAERDGSLWAWLQLSLGGALLAFLADGFAAMAAGWALAGLAGARLAGWRDPARGIAAATRAAVAVTALMGAAALLFWGLGGEYDGTDYLAAQDDPYVVGHGVAGKGPAALTMTARPGTLVYLDDERVPSMRAPFVRAPIAPGPHVLRLRASESQDDAARLGVSIAQGDDASLVPRRPTLSLHVVRDQLALRDHAGVEDGRGRVEQRLAPGGVALVAAVLIALLVAAAAMSSVPPSPRSPPALAALSAAGTTAMLGPVMLLRTDFLLPSAAHAGIVVACAGAELLLAAVWRALGHVGAERWRVLAASAPSGLVLVALGLGGASRALATMGVAGVGAAVVELGSLSAIARTPGAPGEEGLLVRAAGRWGALVASMDRWVVGGVMGAIGGAMRALAWTAAVADERVVSLPAARVASRVQRLGAGVEAAIGLSLGRVAWALVVAGGLGVLLHAVWPVG